MGVRGSRGDTDLVVLVRSPEPVTRTVTLSYLAQLPSATRGRSEGLGQIAGRAPRPTLREDAGATSSGFTRRSRGSPPERPGVALRNPTPLPFGSVRQAQVHGLASAARCDVVAPNRSPRRYDSVRPRHRLGAAHHAPTRSVSPRDRDAHEASSFRAIPNSAAPRPPPRFSNTTPPPASTRIVPANRADLPSSYRSAAVSRVCRPQPHQSRRTQQFTFSIFLDDTRGQARDDGGRCFDAVSPPSKRSRLNPAGSRTIRVSLIRAKPPRALRVIDPELRKGARYTVTERS